MSARRDLTGVLCDANADGFHAARVLYRGILRGLDETGYLSKLPYRDTERIAVSILRQITATVELDWVSGDRKRNVASFCADLLNWSEQQERCLFTVGSSGLVRYDVTAGGCPDDDTELEDETGATEV